ncbi:MAG: cob(I)yrinic acid a,c-diamide adenosyltransferase [Candidatus Paceibacterota bacterium]|jgi:cob(I)alamin adenosyltransferase
MIIVFTGDGKGKTTAALGQAIRTLGRGRRVLMIQFIKGPWRSGEDYLVEKIKNEKEKIKNIDPGLLSGLENFYDFEIKKMGLGFVGILGDSLPREEHEKAASEALLYFKKVQKEGKYDLIILDEVNVAISLGLIGVSEVLKAIKETPDEKFVILTGRNAPKELIEAAHLVTEMREIKHPFNDGKLAKIALDF